MQISVIHSSAAIKVGDLKIHNKTMSFTQTHIGEKEEKDKEYFQTILCIQILSIQSDENNISSDQYFNY